VLVLREFGAELADGEGVEVLEAIDKVGDGEADDEEVGNDNSDEEVDEVSESSKAADKTIARIMRLTLEADGPE
jgi:hypothetical protein